MLQPSPETLREKLFCKAKLAEGAKRYEHMLFFMKQLVQSTAPPADLSPRERCLLGASFRNFIALPRASLRLAASTTCAWTDPHAYPLATTYLCRSRREVSDACTEFVQMIDGRLLPFSVSVESRVFYLTLKADFSWYLAESKGWGDGLKDGGVSNSAYMEALEVARKLDSMDPYRLALDVSSAEFYYKFMNMPKQAISHVDRAILESGLNEPETKPAASLISFEGGFQLAANLVSLKQKLHNLLSNQVAAGPSDAPAQAGPSYAPAQSRPTVSAQAGLSNLWALPTPFNAPAQYVPFNVSAQAGPSYAPAQYGPFNVLAQPGPFNATAQYVPSNVSAQAGPSYTPAQAGPSNVLAQARRSNVLALPGPSNAPAQYVPFNVSAQAGPSNVSAQVGSSISNVWDGSSYSPVQYVPFNVSDEVGPSNDWAEAGPSNVWAEAGPSDVPASDVADNPRVMTQLESSNDWDLEEYVPFNIWAEDEPSNDWAEAGPSNVPASDVADNPRVMTEVGSPDVLAQAGPSDGPAQSVPCNVSAEAGPSNVWAEAGPSDVWAEDGPSNVPASDVAENPREMKQQDDGPEDQQEQGEDKE